MKVVEPLLKSSRKGFLSRRSTIEINCLDQVYEIIINIDFGFLLKRLLEDPMIVTAMRTS